jgi:hypothetical protein
MRLTFHYTETYEKYDWEIKAQTYEAIDFSLHFSWAFLFYLRDSSMAVYWSHISTKSSTPPTTIRKGTIFKTEKIPDGVHLYTGNIPHNYYPSADAFCEALNTVIMSVVEKYTTKKVLADKPVFRMEKFNTADNIGNSITGKCVFTPLPFFKITLHPFILKLLKLENTEEQHTGTTIVVMPTATREFFYLYTNIIASHTYSGAVNILRVINNNTTTPNEKIMLSFPHLYYHPISQLHIPNIQIFITDSYTHFTLPFQKEVTCLLHFRRCPILNSNNNIHSV